MGDYPVQLIEPYRFDEIRNVYEGTAEITSQLEIHDFMDWLQLASVVFCIAGIFLILCAAVFLYKLLKKPEPTSYGNGKDQPFHKGTRSENGSANVRFSDKLESDHQSAASISTVSSDSMRTVIDRLQADCVVDIYADTTVENVEIIPAIPTSADLEQNINTWTCDVCRQKTETWV